MLFQAHQKILFIGDSITDAGRRDINIPWGLGYVSIVRDCLLAHYPERKLQLLNQGVSGNTTRDLRARWQPDVIAHQPDWLVIKIGINDVWRSFSGNADEAVELAEYTENMHQLLDQTCTQTQASLILITPYLIEADRQQPMRAAMDRYAAVVKALAAEYTAVLVDTQAAFDQALQHTQPEDWADDQIHPNSLGNTVIALAFLRAIGFEL